MILIKIKNGVAVARMGRNDFECDENWERCLWQKVRWFLFKYFTTFNNQQQIGIWCKRGGLGIMLWRNYSVGKFIDEECIALNLFNLCLIQKSLPWNWKLHRRGYSDVLWIFQTEACPISVKGKLQRAIFVLQVF